MGMDRMGNRNGKSNWQTLKKFYPEPDLFINVDYDGDIENYTKVGEEIWSNCYKK